MDLLGEMQKTIAEAKEAGLEEYAAKLETAINKLGEVAMHMGKTAMSEKVLNAFAFAHPFMEVVGDVVTAWMLLWRASVAAPKVETSKKDADFYKGLVKSAEFFLNSVLPITLGKMEAILATNGAAMEIEESSFGG